MSATIATMPAAEPAADAGPAGAPASNISNGPMIRLPDDFLRLPMPQQVFAGGAPPPLNPQLAGNLVVTVVEGALRKNYSVFARNDAFCRLFCNNQVFQTVVDYNGGKKPRWNQTFRFGGVFMGLQDLRVEVLDQCTFSDDILGFATVPLAPLWDSPAGIDDVFEIKSANGTLEGSVRLIVHYNQHVVYTQQPQMALVRGVGLLGDPYLYQVPTGMTTTTAAGPVGLQGMPLQGMPMQQQPQQQMQHPHIHGPTPQQRASADDSATDRAVQEVIAQQRTEAQSGLKSMFPDMEEDILVDVLRSCNWEADRAAEQLLGMGCETPTEGPQDSEA